MSARSTLPVAMDHGLDKVAHFGAYLVFGALLAFATSRFRLPPLLAVAIGSGYGLIDEVHQSMVPGRDASSGDWVADTLGTIAGVLLYLLVWRLRAGHRNAEFGTTAEEIST